MASNRRYNLRSRKYITPRAELIYSELADEDGFYSPSYGIKQLYDFIRTYLPDVDIFELIPLLNNLDKHNNYKAAGSNYGPYMLRWFPNSYWVENFFIVTESNLHHRYNWYGFDVDNIWKELPYPEGIRQASWKAFEELREFLRPTLKPVLDAINEERKKKRDERRAKWEAYKAARDIMPASHPVLDRHDATCDTSSDTARDCQENVIVEPSNPTPSVPAVKKELTPEEKKWFEERKQGKLLYKMFMSGVMSVTVTMKKAIHKIIYGKDEANNVTSMKLNFAIPFKPDTDFETQLFGAKITKAESHLVLSFASSMIVLSYEETKQIKQLLGPKLTAKPIKQLIASINYGKNATGFITNLTINFCTPLSPDRDFETELFGEKIALVTL